MSKIKFEELGLNERVLDAILALGFETPSPIQEKAIPVLLEGKDVIGQAQTGTGKTLAFASVVLSQLENVHEKGVKAIILSPTRELAMQIQEEIVKIGRFSSLKSTVVFGGSGIERQIREIKRGVDIVVGTPGRVMDLMRRHVLDLSKISFAVLDEADEMLNMGFVEDIETILSSTNPNRQTLLFSATMPPAIFDIARKYMHKDMMHIAIASKSRTASTVEQFYFEIRPQDRYEALCRLIDGNQMESVIIFCKTKKGVDELVSSMSKSGYHAEGMHGDLSQELRLETLRRFKSGKLSFLVATDVAARGIDVENITHVINYALPQDVEAYVHRIGRTGRAKRTGVAYSLVTPRERGLLSDIERINRTKIEQANLPSLKDILKSKDATLIEEIQDVTQSGLHKGYRQELQNLSQQELLNIASSLYYLQVLNHLGYDYQEENIGMQKSVGAVYLELGRGYSTTPAAVVRFLIENVKLKKEDIGRIDLQQRAVLVELTTKKAVIQTLKNSENKRFAGRRIRAKEKK